MNIQKNYIITSIAVIISLVIISVATFIVLTSGEEKKIIENGFIQPTIGKITSTWGVQKKGLNDREVQVGLDIANNEGTPVVAIADGVIKEVGADCPKVGYYGSPCNNGYGNYLLITHKVNGETYDALYANLSSLVKVGVDSQIKQGEIIGYMGTSGNSTGPHLHIELHQDYRDGLNNVVNPLLYIPFKS